jgi:WD40 repeat protein
VDARRWLVVATLSGLLAPGAGVRLAGADALDVVWRGGGHAGAIVGLAVSPDGRLLATSSDDDTVKLWDLPSRTLLRTLEDRATNLAFVAPIGASTLSAGGAMRLTETATGKIVWTTEDFGARRVAVSPDGTCGVVTRERQIALKGDATAIDRQTVLFDVETGMPRLTFRPYDAHPDPVVFSPDGQTVAIGYLDTANVLLWETATGTVRQAFGPVGGSITSVAFDPAGKLLAAGSKDDLVHLWDLDTGRETLRLSGHEDPVAAVAFTADGRRVASGSATSLRVWQVASGREQQKFDEQTGGTKALQFVPGETVLVSGSDDGHARLWDLAKKRQVAVIGAHTGAVRAVAISPDSTRVASASDDHTIRIWKLDSRKPGGDLLGVLRRHGAPVNALAWSPDGKLLASGSGDLGGDSVDDSVRLLDVDKLRELRVVGRHGRAVRAVVFTRDGRNNVISGGADRMLALWEPRTTVELHALNHGVTALAWSPDGKMLAAGYDEGVGRRGVRFWNVEKRMQAARPLRPLDARALAWSPDGKKIAVATEANDVEVWKVRPGSKNERLCTIATGGRLADVTFAPGGEIAAAVDARIVLYSEVSGEPLAVFDTETGTGVRTLAYSRDGKFLVFGRDDATVVAARTP